MHVHVNRSCSSSLPPRGTRGSGAAVGANLAEQGLICLVLRKVATFLCNYVVYYIILLNKTWCAATLFMATWLMHMPCMYKTPKNVRQSSTQLKLRVQDTQAWLSLGVADTFHGSTDLATRTLANPYITLCYTLKECICTFAHAVPAADHVSMIGRQHDKPTHSAVCQSMI